MKCAECGHLYASHGGLMDKCGALDGAGDVCDCQGFIYPRHHNQIELPFPERKLS